MPTRMRTSAPAAKVNAATIAAALTTIALYLIDRYLLPGEPLSDVIAVATGTLITAAVTFAAGYLTPPAGRDQVVTPPPAAPSAVPPPP